MNNLLNGGGKEEIPAESIELDQDHAQIKVGETLQLVASVKPENATDKVEWESNNEEIATVSDNGLVTALSEGWATISANAGKQSAFCRIEVTKASEGEGPVTETAPEGPRVCWQTSGNDGSNRLYVDGELFSKSDATVTYIKNEGPWIWYYAKNDGFYREKTKMLDFGKTELGDHYLFQAFDVKNGYIHILLSEQSPSKYYSVRSINLETGESREVKLNMKPFADMVCCTVETSICAADDGKVYALVSGRENGTTYSGAFQWCSILYTVKPDSFEAEATELIKGDDVSSMVGDLEIGPDGSVYALVNYRLLNDNSAKKAFVLFKDGEEVRRYEGYSDKASSTPSGISIDGTDVYLFLKQDGSQTADIYKNADKILGNFTSISGGKIAFIGNGLYCYAINKVEQNTTATKLYRSDNKVLFSQYTWIMQVVVAK